MDDDNNRNNIEDVEDIVEEQNLNDDGEVIQPEEEELGPMDDDGEDDDDEDDSDNGDDNDFQPFIVMEELAIEEDQQWVNYQSDDEESPEEDANAEHYDVTLPSRHMYLGETQELRGRTVQDENDYITVPILHDNSLMMNLVLVPSQTIPMTVFHPVNISMLRNVIDKDRTFGVVQSKYSENGSEFAKYGTTAEIYEFQEEELNGALSVKAKGRQRFKLLSTRRETTGLVVARVKILPEIQMECPFEMMRLHSLDKMTLPPPSDESSNVAQTRNLADVRTANCWRVRSRNAWLTPWPSWVYDQYDVQLLSQRVVNEIKKSTMVEPHSVKVPCDPQELSNWAAINLPLDDSHRLALLSLNTPIQRLRYILSVLDKCKMLTCINCEESIANTSDIFSMSVEGPQGTYVNPGGYVHEMLTLTKSRNLSYYGRPSTEHSWFPGYAWTVASCSRCRSHMGWKFTATKKKLTPQKFYGLTRKTVTAKLVWEDEEGDILHVI